MKNLFLSVLLAVTFGGCSFDFLNLASEDTTKILSSADGVKCEILSYERHSKTNYTYKFKVLKNNQIYRANSPRYYYNSGDMVFVMIKNGVIINMILDQRNPNSQTRNSGANDGEIVKKVLRQNNEISVPKSENISF